MIETKVVFEDYSADYFENCLELFNQNCPKYFATNERQDYIEFLQTPPPKYKVGLIDEKVVAVFGLDIDKTVNRSRITWIMTLPQTQAKGLGKAMMCYAIEMTKQENINAIDIAASHLSAPFFAKFGAKIIKEIPNGWGVDMHRIDMELLL